MSLDRDGAELHSAVLDGVQHQALSDLLELSTETGIRIFGHRRLSDWLVHGPVGHLVRNVLGAGTRPVRAILFDKSTDSNWALGWHQDRVIAVRERVELEGFDHWTVKAGVAHVEPPFEIIEAMVTARLHLDPVRELNAPLLIVPGSHLLGRIDEAAIEAAVDELGTAACLAETGDAWLYRTAILHASERSVSTGRRRVLHVDFAAQDLPPDIEWLGLA